MTVKNLTVAITAHREGELILENLHSVINSIQHASQRVNFNYEILIGIDKGDELTKARVSEFINSHKKFNLKALNTSFGDVGKSRNNLCENSTFDFIAFLDGDDIWCDNWVYLVLKKFTIEQNYILHPELTLFADEDYFLIHKNLDSRSLKFKFYAQLLENYWTSSFACKKELVIKCPFETGSVEGDNLYAYEDWTFFTKTLFHKVHHVILKDTFHLHRKKKVSNTNLSVAMKKLPHPLKF